MSSEKSVRIGDMTVGGGAPIAVQSMTTADTKDVDAVLSQIRALADAGCDIVRIALYDRRCAALVPKICSASPVPIVGDVHFDPEIAVLAAEKGIAKIRINPGNVGNKEQVARVAHAAKMAGIPIRVGANAGSLRASQRAWGESPEEEARALVAAALEEAQQLEAVHFEDIVVSLKASSVPVSVLAARLMALLRPYPLHLGITEAGTWDTAIVKSAAGIGALLLEGIGDTIRVSISGDPVREAHAAHAILEACGLEKPRVEVIACPTCARCSLAVEELAKSIEGYARSVATRPVKIAVMGCAVNGPGEARGADFGIAGAPDGAVLFRNGKVVRKLPKDEALSALEREARDWERMGEKSSVIL